MSEHGMVAENVLHGGWQKLYRFRNGFGASVINHAFSRGTEMAVIKWGGSDYELTYKTPITDDVIGHLSSSEVEELLYRIAALPGADSGDDSDSEQTAPAVAAQDVESGDWVVINGDKVKVADVVTVLVLESGEEVRFSPSDPITVLRDEPWTPGVGGGH